MDFNNLFDVRRLNKKGFDKRDKFLSRIFGIFSEEIIRIWCKTEYSPYIDRGRPTIYLNGNRNIKSTLDFALENKVNKKVYVTEMKCEIQYENYKYLELHSTKQLRHHEAKVAFKRFLELAECKEKYVVKINGKECDNIDGVILIWGKTDKSKVNAICREKKLSEILCLESIINELIENTNQEYFEFLEKRKEWIYSFFHGLSR